MDHPISDPNDVDEVEAWLTTPAIGDYLSPPAKRHLWCDTKSKAGFYCSQPKGHDGPHVACQADGRVRDVWVCG